MVNDPKATAPTPAPPAAAPAASAPGAKVKTAYEGVATTTMDLPRARTVRGTAYGPGKDVKVPQTVADILKAEDAKTAKAKSE